MTSYSTALVDQAVYRDFFSRSGIVQQGPANGYVFQLREPGISGTIDLYAGFPGQFDCGQHHSVEPGGNQQLAAPRRAGFD
jgi:hypothetical protein